MKMHQEKDNHIHTYIP